MVEYRQMKRLRFICSRLCSRALIVYPDRDSAVIPHRHRMQKRCFLLCAGLLTATALLHGILTGFGDTYAIAGSTRFDDIDSFVSFMEQDIPYAEDGISYMDGYAIERIPLEDAVIAAQYFDADGNPITEEEARRRTITDSDGNVVISYLARNESVVSISHGAPGEDNFLPIYVTTRADVIAAQQKVRLYGAVFTVLYIVEVLFCGFLYLLLRNLRRTA